MCYNIDNKHETVSIMFDIWNRRYTGSKYKLSSWISELIAENCKGNSFCDIFAGTGIISYSMLEKMKKIYINDFLYSNEVIYKAFFDQGSYDKGLIADYCSRFQALSVADLEDNYISDNFGGKFFSLADAKLIGYIRETIDADKNKMSEKEFDILLASLLYSADKCANTVGHYDAYIKGHKIPDSFTFDLINPYKTKKSQVFISREDSNEFAKKLKCDIVYIDPPYNSRQYSRFYHVLENITCWRKPELHGVALKPDPENMSDYCRNSAKIVFKDLIDNLDCKYIVVSYNNTYESKSSSSKNKMTFEDIESALSSRGIVQKHETSHNYFNAGKTDFNDHKEFIFIVKVK